MYLTGVLGQSPKQEVSVSLCLPLRSGPGVAVAYRNGADW